jgi:ribosomal protein S18 acetylase RimI-like enzyme
MELSVESLPAFQELDDSLCEEIEAFITAGKLSPEDAPGYDGWLTAREMGSRALVGCVGYERETEGDTANIYMQSLVVDKDHRRSGIGKLLTDELFETAVSPNENLVALTLFWNNDFYQKLGFYRVNAKEIKAQDEIAGREKHKRCTAWVKEKR